MTENQTTPTPAERRAVAEIVLPEDRHKWLRTAFERDTLSQNCERVVLEDGLLRARIAASYGNAPSGRFFVKPGPEHARFESERGVFFADAMLDALWACALAHVRELERRKAEAAALATARSRFPLGTRVTSPKFGPGVVAEVVPSGALITIHYDSGEKRCHDPTRTDLAPEPDPEPPRFFPGERVRIVRRGAWLNGPPEGAVAVVTRTNRGGAWVRAKGVFEVCEPWYPNHALAPETAARMIPYGGAR